VGVYEVLSGSYLFNDPKDLKKAEENALKIVELAPTSPGAEIQLGDCYRAQNDFQKAKDAYAKAVTLDPTAPEAYYKEGHANTYLGNMEEARKNYADGGSHDITKSASILNAAFTYLYAGGDYKAATKYIMDGCAKLDTSAAAKARLNDEKSNCLIACATIAAHKGDAAMLKELVAMIQPVSDQLANDIGTPEAKTFTKADALNWQAMIAITEGKLDDAKARAEEMKTTLDPIKDNRKLEGYHFLMGMISMKQKNYKDAATHFAESDMNSIYNKYWMAMANEAAGNKDKAMSLYKEVAAYNFNDVGNALVRSEVKKKLATK
jgi:tetratricopeptide (TPR) repeat protein